MDTLFDLSETINGEIVTYDKIHRNQSTFLSGVEKSFHNWFRLTPSFGADLVKSILYEFNASTDSVILDPFAGASTTLIESKLLGFKSYGFEINPFLHFVGKTNLFWDFNKDSLQQLSKNIRTKYISDIQYFGKSDCENLPFKIPEIHNVYRWWRPDILKQLLILKNAIITETSHFDTVYKNFFNLALAGVLVPHLTNVTLGKLQLHFIDRTNHKIDVESIYFSHLDMMITDITNIPDNTKTVESTLINIDSTTVNTTTIPDKIDIVITSPPYPNRYSYVWNTRPYLYFFDIFSGPKEASSLDMKTIGGTWGTATSILNKGIIEPISKDIADIILPTTENIRLQDNLMANYVMKYFNMLYSQIEKMIPLLSHEPKIVYVVGNSEIKGVFVETDILLSKIFKSFGFQSTSINRFRKRNSGKNLFESNVYAR